MTKEETNSNDVTNNDQVVDELLKDFQDTCTTKQSGDNETENSLGSDKVSTSNFDTNSKPGNSNESKLDQESTSNAEVDELVEEKIVEKRHDYIDEEEMKQRELGYSQQDIERLKAEADEMKQKGNGHFKNSEYKESTDCYTLGLRTCPLVYQKERAVLYANRAAAKVKLGEDEPALEDCSKAIELDPTYVRAVLRRAQLYEALDRLDESLEDFKKLLELDPNNKEAVIACQRLPPIIHERNEKLKTEMLGKLKDLGNVFLRPFGLSTDNFKMVQDPNTGGYSVSFQNS